jgi:DNA-binding beta-propeller fold protein YncE
MSADGKTAVSWGVDRSIRRWEAATGKQLSCFHLPQGATMATLAPDGRSVALASGNNSILVLDTGTGKELHKLAGSQNGTSALAYSPDGMTLAARGGDNAIRLYDVARGGEARLITPQAANNPAPGGVVALKLGARIGGNSSAGLVFSPDGKVLASHGSPSAAGMRGAVVAPRNAAGANRATIDLYDVTVGKAVRKIELTQPAVSITFSPDGRVLATENADHSVTLWEVASGKERAQLGKAVAANPAPNAAGQVFAVKVAGLVTSAEPAGPTTLAFSPDGRALVSRGSDNAVNVWDVTAGKDVSHFKGHEGRVETVAFAPDGKAIATGSADTTILLWDATALMNEFPKPQTIDLAEEAVEPLWNDLAGEDAAKALQGVLKLAGAPKQVVPFLVERLKAAAAVDPQKIERWLTELEDDKFAVRQEASASLLKTGEQAVPALQKVLTSQPTIETRKRAEELLEKLTGGNLTTEQLRTVRAVEALERMATPEARQLLQTLAQGAPGALTTRQAQAALDRLAR